MKLYLKDKVLAIILCITVIFAITGLLAAFKVNKSCVIAEIIIIAAAFVADITVDYYKRNRFYKDFLCKLENLDQKYLITEMLGSPEFEEGKILKESLYEIDKSMKERINTLEDRNNEFKEYLEMWIHEIKLPLSGLTLMNYNGNMNQEKQRSFIRKIEHYVEQILFMARADAAEKDYLIKKVTLESIVNKSVISNRDMLIESRVTIEKDNLNLDMMTDSKWLEFILGQIISNSVKYAGDNERKIKFYGYENVAENKTVLVAEDNGVGISNEDIKRVFEKTFTGKNGRKVEQSTGMGLYICKKLCMKMGHNIWIESRENEYTRVNIEFGKETWYLKEE